jgi:hypothetical protein
MIISPYEETETTRSAPNPLGAYINAKCRDQEAGELHANLFDSDEHVARIQAVAEILKAFFGSYPNYYTKRGLGIRMGKPFESVKMCDVGRFLNKKTMKQKSEGLYEPLLALGNIKVKSINGHFLVSVY